MSWYVAPCLLALTREVNDQYAPPTWPTASVGDGAVGDTSHQARKSDHNPDWSAGGVVRAVDIGIEGRDGDAIVKEAVGDPRVYYVIHKGIIRSRTYGWVARRYTGSNPHNHHVHISCRSGRAYENDTRPWFGTQKPKRVKPGPVNAEAIRDQALILIGEKDGKRRSLLGVKRIQYGLYHQGHRDIVVDGWWGEATADAWGAYEKSVGVSGRPRVPDLETLRAFDRRVWAVKGVS